jgi:eukaryotic-like serine/threonine-protein kinase
VTGNRTVLGPGSKVRPGAAFEILAEQKLDELRQPHAPAFGAICDERQGESFFALISDPLLPPRYELVEKLAAMRLDNVLTPVAWGPVDLPGLAPASFATVFERPRGARILASMKETIPRFTGDDVWRGALPPLIAALKAFAEARITHRNIRPTNLFYSGTKKQLMLGDAVSAPAGYAQPAGFEPIEGAMALPHCRGAGMPADDLYALGVTLVHLLLGEDPTAGVDPKELLRGKIEHGTFTTLVAGKRMPPELIEMLRGLMADDVSERWTIEDIETWMEGLRLKPRHMGPTGIVATRPFEFAGQNSYTARAVAHAFAADPVAGARAVRSNEFEIWLQRSLADDKRAVAVAAVRADWNEKGANATQDLRVTARACIALDPLAPIRYGDFALAIDSFPEALIAAFNGNGSLQTIGEILTARLPQFWMSAQTTLRPEVLAMNTAKPFDTMRRYAEDPRPGFGLERVLYELNPLLHCFSPTIQADRVIEARQVLDALEAAAARGALGDTILDRHLAAFIAARTRNLARDALEFLNGTPRQKVLGTLAILAHLQGAHGPQTLPALGKHFARQAELVVEMFHSRSRRKRLVAEIQKLAARGTLSDLFWLVNGSSERGGDIQGFAAAQREYAAIGQALAALGRSAHTRPAEAAELGGSAGVIAAGFLAVTVAFIAAMNTW